MKTLHQGTKAEQRACLAYLALMQAADSVTLAVQAQLAQAGLTLGQFMVLEALMRRSPLSQRELADNLLRSSGNTSVVLANLERAGLVQRRRLQEDRRVQLVSLTPRGQQLIAEIFPQHVALLVRRMAGLDAGELARLGVLCRKLSRSHAGYRPRSKSHMHLSVREGGEKDTHVLPRVMSFHR